MNISRVIRHNFGSNFDKVYVRDNRSGLPTPLSMGVFLQLTFPSKNRMEKWSFRKNESHRSWSGRLRSMRFYNFCKCFYLGLFLKYLPQKIVIIAKMHSLALVVEYKKSAGVRFHSCGKFLSEDPLFKRTLLKKLAEEKSPRKGKWISRSDCKAHITSHNYHSNSVA